MKKVFRIVLAATMLLVALAGCTPSVENITARTPQPLTVGETIDLNDILTIEPMNIQTELNFDAADESIATIKNGVLTAVSPGNILVTVTEPKSGLSTDVNIIVTQPVEAIALNKAVYDMTTGEKLDLMSVFTVIPANATYETIDIEFSNSDHITISEDNVLTAISAGTTQVTISIGGKSAEMTVHVFPNIEVAINPAEAGLVVGVSGSLNAVVTETEMDIENEAAANPIEYTYAWISDDENVVAVSGTNGTAVITGISAGKATITVKVFYNEQEVGTATTNIAVVAKTVSTNTNTGAGSRPGNTGGGNTGTNNTGGDTGGSGGGTTNPPPADDGRITNNPVDSPCDGTCTEPGCCWVYMPIDNGDTDMSAAPDF